MPVCSKCNRMAATVEMRRSPKGGYLCKEKSRCLKPHRIIRTAGYRLALRSTSTAISEQTVIEAVKFVAAEVDHIDKTVVHVKRLTDQSRSYGRAYKWIPEITNLDGLNRREWRSLITVRDHLGDVPSFVGTLAHEFKHIEQYRTRRPVSEVACEAFADWVVRKWLEKKRTAAAAAAH